MANQCFSSEIAFDLNNPQRACYAVTRYCSTLDLFYDPATRQTRIKFEQSTKRIDGCQNKPTTTKNSESLKDGKFKLVTTALNIDDPNFVSYGGTIDMEITLPNMGTSYIFIDSFKECSRPCCYDGKVDGKPTLVRLIHTINWANYDPRAGKLKNTQEREKIDKFLNDLKTKGSLLGEYFSDFLTGELFSNRLYGLREGDIGAQREYVYGGASIKGNEMLEMEAAALTRVDFREEILKKAKSLGLSQDCTLAQTYCRGCDETTVRDPRFAEFVDQSTL